MKESAKKNEGHAHASKGALEKNARMGRRALAQKDVLSLAWRLAEPICTAEGVELIHVEYQREPSGRVLRIYIDRPGGITLDDCTTISRQLGDLLDIKLEGEASYTLEVSSPGPERPLSRLSDFERFTGKTARIKTALSIDGQKNFKGVLSKIADGHITLITATKTVVIPLQEIKRARLVHSNGD